VPIYQIPVMQIIIILGSSFFLVQQHSLEKKKKFKIKSHLKKKKNTHNIDFVENDTNKKTISFFLI